MEKRHTKQILSAQILSASETVRIVTETRKNSEKVLSYQLVIEDEDAIAGSTVETLKINRTEYEENTPGMLLASSANVASEAKYIPCVPQPKADGSPVEFVFKASPEFKNPYRIHLVLKIEESF